MLKKTLKTLIIAFSQTSKRALECGRKAALSRSSLKIHFTHLTISPKASAAKRTSSLQGIYFNHLPSNKTYNWHMNS
jgi:hypothetical protein